MPLPRQVCAASPAMARHKGPRVQGRQGEGASSVPSQATSCAEASRMDGCRAVGDLAVVLAGVVLRAYASPVLPRRRPVPRRYPHRRCPASRLHACEADMQCCLVDALAADVLDTGFTHTRLQVVVLPCRCTRSRPAGCPCGWWPAAKTIAPMGDNVGARCCLVVVVLAAGVLKANSTMAAVRTSLQQPSLCDARHLRGRWSPAPPT
jgi:hypothetical protein